MLKQLTLITLLLTNGIVQAAWTGGIEGGTTVSGDGGNATRLRLRLEERSRPFSQHLHFDLIRYPEGGNAQQYSYRPQYWIADGGYVYTEGTVRIDKPSGIERATLLGGGLGLQFMESAVGSLWMEFGVGREKTRYSDSEGSLEQSVFVTRGGWWQNLGDRFVFELEGEGIAKDISRRTTADASIGLKVPAGVIKLTQRFTRLRQDGLDTMSDNDRFLSYSYRF